MPGVSIHVVDVTRGVVAAGMAVDLYRIDAGEDRRLIASGGIGRTGLLQHEALDQVFEPGVYEARFHIADFYRDAVGVTADIPFLDVVSYRFGIADPDAHYHLPMKCTPWGYSCFRGGA